MKIINIDIDSSINLKTIEDVDTGIIKNINSDLKIPTGNYQNILLNFNFISPTVKTSDNLFASFFIDKENSIDVHITNIKVNDRDFSTACYIPAEVFEKPCKVALGVYGFRLNEDGSLDKRMSLIPITKIVVKGSYDPDSKESVIPTPTAFEVYFDQVKTAGEYLESFRQETEAKIDNYIIDKISYMRKYENHKYITKETSAIYLDLDVEYRTTDILEVKVNGCDLILGKDYYVENNEINLTIPLKAGNTIYYSIERSVASNAEDYENLRGEDGLGVPTGGTTGQVLAKKSNADNDTEWVSLFDIFYPVGTYYETSNGNFNPNISWSGVWELDNDGTTLVSKSNVEGSKFNVELGTILGEEEVQLDLPNYQYKVWNNDDKNAENDLSFLWKPEGSDYGLGSVYYTNKNVPHNNVQPSKVGNRWHRIA